MPALVMGVFAFVLVIVISVALTAYKNKQIYKIRLYFHRHGVTLTYCRTFDLFDGDNDTVYTFVEAKRIMDNHELN